MAVSCLKIIAKILRLDKIARAKHRQRVGELCLEPRMAIVDVNTQACFSPGLWHKEAYDGEIFILRFYTEKFIRH